MCLRQVQWAGRDKLWGLSGLVPAGWRTERSLVTIHVGGPFISRSRAVPEGWASRRRRTGLPTLAYELSGPVTSFGGAQSKWTGEEIQQEVMLASRPG